MGDGHGSRGAQPPVQAVRLQPSGAHVAAYNDAMTGASSADLFLQAQRAVRQRADYVMVLIGANYVCTDSGAR